MDDEQNNSNEDSLDMDQDIQRMKNSAKGKISMAKDVISAGKGKGKKKINSARTMGDSPGKVAARSVGKGIKMKGQAEKATGTATKAAGIGTQATGKGMQAAGKGVQAASEALAAIPYVGAVLASIGKGIGTAIQTTGKGLDKAGKGMQKAGDKITQKGQKDEELGEKIEETGDTSGASDASGGEMPSIPGLPQSMKVPKFDIKDLLKKGLMDGKKKLIIIGVAIAVVILIIILILLLDVSSKKNEGSYQEGDMSNVPYVVTSSIMDKITIVQDSSGAYSYAFESDSGETETLTEAINEALDTLAANNCSSLGYLGNTREERVALIKKMVKAEIATQYPDLTGSYYLYAATSTSPTSSAAWDNGKDYCVDITNVNSMPLCNEEQLLKIVQSTTSTTEEGRANMLTVVPSLVELQEKYKVNAVFVLAIIMKESGWGRGWDLIDKSTHNWSSIKVYGDTPGYVDRNGTKWRIFDSFTDAAEYTFKLIANPEGSYYGSGLYTVYSIGNVYCEPSKEDGINHWPPGVSAFIQEFYNIIGVTPNTADEPTIDISGGTSSTDDSTTTTSSSSKKSSKKKKTASNTIANSTTNNTTADSTATNTTTNTTTTTTTGNTTKNTTTSADTTGNTTNSNTTTETTTESTKNSNTTNSSNTTTDATTDSDAATSMKNDTINGNIQVERKTENGSTQKLTYVDPSVFSSLIAENDSRVMNYFTLQKNTTTSNSTSSSGGVVLQGSDVATQIWNFLTGDMGYSDAVAAGIMGNAMEESGGQTLTGLDPTARNSINGGHYGIFQWSLEYNPELDNADLSTQLQFFKDKWIGTFDTYAKNYREGFSYEQFKQLQDPEQAAIAFATVMERYEGASNTYAKTGSTAKYTKRMENAKNAYATLAGTSSGTNSMSSSNTNASSSSNTTASNSTNTTTSSSSNTTASNSTNTTASTSSNTTASSSSNSTSSSSSSASTANNSTSTTASSSNAKTNANGKTWLEVCQDCHKFLEDNNYYYDNGRSVPIVAGESIHYVDCSSYVTWCLYEFGYTDFKWQLVTTSTEPEWCGKNLETIYSNISEHDITNLPLLQAGDIILENGHTQIFAGYDTDGIGIWWNCGSDEAILRSYGQEKYNHTGKAIIAVYRVPGAGSGSVVTSLDNFLFIGDSRYSTVAGKIQELGNNITNVGVGSSSIDEWLKVAQNGGTGTVQPGTDHEKNVDITGSYSGVSVQLGANSVYKRVDSAVQEMKDFLTTLQTIQSCPIFVNSCLGISGASLGSSYKWDPATMQSCIDQFNEQVKAFCDSTQGLYYVDISSGMMDESNGQVKSEYLGDGLHCNTAGAEIFTTNIKEAILATGAASTSSTSSSTTSTSKYIMIVADKTTVTTSTTESYSYSHSTAVDTASGTSVNATRFTDTPASTQTDSNTTTTYSQKNVDYQNALKTYTLYFDFMWAMLVENSKDNSLIEDWLTLADDSDVTLTVYTDESTSTSTSTQSGGTKTHQQYNSKNKVATTDYYDITETITTTTDKKESKPVVSYADTWLEKYENAPNTYSEYQAKTSETITMKTDAKSSEDNIVKILQRHKSTAKAMYREEYIVQAMLENNDKVSFMIDIYDSILKIALGYETDINNTKLKNILSSTGFDLTNSNTVVKKVLKYDALNLSDTDKENLYKFVEQVGEGCTEDEKKYLASVVLNRALSGDYSSTNVTSLLKSKSSSKLENFSYKKLNDVTASSETKSAVDYVLENGDQAQFATTYSTKEVNDSDYTKTVSGSKYTFYSDKESKADLELMQTTTTVSSSVGTFDGANYPQGFTKCSDCGVWKTTSGTGIQAVYKTDRHTYKIYAQGCGPYSAITYWDGTIRTDGCGLSSSAIILTGYGIDATPETVLNDGLCPYGSIDFCSKELTKYGVQNHYVSGESKEAIIANLKAGRPVLIHVHHDSSMRIGNRSYSAHFLTLLGINESGQILLGDPGSTWNSGYFDQSQIFTGAISDALIIDSD